MRRSTTRILARSTGYLALLALLAGCQHATAPIRFPGDLAPGRARTSLPGNLLQTVEVTPASPASGGDVTVRSVVVNLGSSPVTLESRMCGLDYAGTLGLTPPPAVLKCAVYSQAGPLAPGDSVVTLDQMRVSSMPGSYELRVRHALAPEGWAAMNVVVRQ